MLTVLLCLLYRLLTEVYPKCKDTKTYSCFVMDSAGFLIMHEDFLLSSAVASDVEYVHITEKDKYVAEDLINKGYLRKKGCRDLEEIQMQSFYEVSLPSAGIDALRSGGRCSKYQLGQIMGTNAYIGSQKFLFHHITQVKMCLFIRTDRCLSRCLSVCLSFSLPGT